MIAHGLGSNQSPCDFRAADGPRTRNLLVGNEVLDQLSYYHDATEVARMWSDQRPLIARVENGRPQLRLSLFTSVHPSAPPGTRTQDLRIKSPQLYQLS